MILPSEKTWIQSFFSQINHLVKYYVYFLVNRKVFSRISSLIFCIVYICHFIWKHLQKIVSIKLSKISKTFLESQKKFNYFFKKVIERTLQKDYFLQKVFFPYILLFIICILTSSFILIRIYQNWCSN